MPVEKVLDDVWLGVKGQSNSEIARTPRNVFRDSVELIVIEVELLIGLGGVKSYQTLINSECYNIYSAVRPGVLTSQAERERTQTIS